MSVALYRDEAVVLRTWKLREADRILSLHTLRHGKVRAVARGARRTRSKLGAVAEPASHIAAQLYRGRSELQTLTQAVTINRFKGLRSDPDTFARASALLEVVDNVASEADPDEQRHVMLVRALATLERSHHPLVMAGFFLKLLALEGLQPELENCVSCGTSDSSVLASVDVIAGGVVCRDCGMRRSISAGALEAMRLILSNRLGQLMRSSSQGGQGNQDGQANRAHQAVGSEVTELAVAFMEAHLERRLRSVTVLRSERP